MEQQENLGTVIPGEELPPNTENTVEEQPNTDAGEIETRARAMGWRPQEEFNGDPSKWRSAEDFVRRGEEELPVLRENLRRMTSTVSDLQSRLSRQEQEHKASFERLDKMSSAALQRQKETLEASYQAAMRNAAAQGDVEAYDRLDAGRRQAVGEFDSQIAEVGKPVETKDQTPQIDDASKATVEGWIVKNPWFKTDGELSGLATWYHGHLQQTKPNLSLEENLRETERFVRQRFPEKFGTAAPSPSPVEGGGSRMSSSQPRSRGWNELPPDAKSQGAKFIKDGLFKDQAEYAKEYWSQ